MDNQKQIAEGFKNLDIQDSIDRVDKLLNSNLPTSIEKIGFSLGIRLALGMALEIKSGLALGSKTSDMIAKWMSKYGEAQVEEAIQTARAFLLNPDKLRTEMEERLFNQEK